MNVDGNKGPKPGPGAGPGAGSGAGDNKQKIESVFKWAPPAKPKRNKVVQ